MRFPYPRFLRAPKSLPLAVLALSLAAILLAACSRSKAPASDAKLLITASTDLGEIEYGQVVAATLSVSNPTSHPIQIRRIDCSCVCLSVVNFPKIIPAGTTDKIQLQIAAAEVGSFDFVATAQIDGLPAEPIMAHLLHSVVKSPSILARQTAAQDGLLIAAPAAIQAQRSSLFIDLREADAFARGTVPGAQNFPLFVLKTKDRLKNASLVLVGDGISESEIYEECRKLRKLGFAKAQVLSGGIRAWKQAGGVLEGTSRLASETGLVGAWKGPHLREAGGWDYLKVNLPNETATSTLALVGQIPYSPDIAQLRSSLTPYISANNPRRLMIVAADDAAYVKIEEALHGLPQRPVFYLSGGLAALASTDTDRRLVGNGTLVSINNYDSQRANSGHPSGVRLSGCSSCPGKK